MAITLKTWGQQLQEVQNAIEAVLTSQRYEINGRMVQRADLQFLQKREEYLTKQYERHGDVIAGSNIQRGSAQVQFSNAD